MAYSDEDLIKAALMDDPEDEQEERSTQTEEVATVADEAQATDTEQSEAAESTADKSKVVEDDDVDTSEEDDQTEDEANEDAKATRKERREERKKSFLESIKAETAQKNAARERLLQGDSDYQPVNYTEQSEFDATVLEEDRAKYGNKQFSEGAKTERFYAEQDNFWTRTEFEGKILETDPKYSFLNESNPDTFDADKAEELNGMYLELVGFDPQTNTVRRTDLSYDKFVRHEVERMERWAGEQEADSSKKIVEQASRSGIRPSGSSRTGLGRLRPGDISKMSAEDVEKNEAEIDRQILSML